MPNLSRQGRGTACRPQNPFTPGIEAVFDVNEYLDNIYKTQGGNEQTIVCNYIIQLVYKLQLFHYLFFKMGDIVTITWKQQIRGGSIDQRLYDYLLELKNGRINPFADKKISGFAKEAENFKSKLKLFFKTANDISHLKDNMSNIIIIIKFLYEKYVINANNIPALFSNPSNTFKISLETSIDTTDINNLLIDLENLKNELDTELEKKKKQSK